MEWMNRERGRAHVKYSFENYQGNSVNQHSTYIYTQLKRKWLIQKRSSHIHYFG